MSAKELTNVKIGEVLQKLERSSKAILKRKLFREALFDSELMILVGDVDMARKFIGEEFNLPDGVLGAYYDYPDCYIRLANTDRAILVHELTHYCLDVMRAKGVVLTQDSEEVLCYMMDYYYEIVSKRLDTIDHLFTDEE